MRTLPIKTPAGFRGLFRGAPGGFVLSLLAVAASAMLGAAEPAPAAPKAGEPAAPAAPKPNSTAACLECHSDNDLSMKKAGQKVSLFIDAKVVNASAHKSLECVDCHEKFDGDATPHRKPMVAVDCVGCHEDTGKKKHAFHPRLALKEIPAGEDTSCVGCHGKHDVAVVKSTAFRFAAAAQPQECGKCHEKARDHFNLSAHGRALATKETNAPDCLACHRQPIAPHGQEKASLAQKLAQTQQCEACHVGKENVAGQALRGVKFVKSFDQSVHGAALQKGQAKAANCVDCHGAHEMNRALSPGARMNKLHVAETCVKCHEAIGQEYRSSAHALALGKGNADSATCTDCHGEHDILGHKDPASRVHKTHVAQQVCADCHASLKLTQKYGISTHAFQTFADSYHGLAVRGGGGEVVNCASCHSSHAIKSQQDPTSSIHKDNLVKTCGQCHPGANTRFTIGKVHVSPESALQSGGTDPILHVIATIYIVLIAATVGGMLIHNTLDFLTKIRHKVALQKGLIVEKPHAHRIYVRMTLDERLQHGTLVISFTLLVITGFMLRYPESWWVVGIRNISSTAFEWRGLIHRIAGVVMTLTGVWHVYGMIFTLRGRQVFLDMLPAKRDFFEPFQLLKYNLGISPTKPAFGRFSYIEKVEYWAMMWGSIIMGLTGVILWFDNTSMGLLTKLGFDISRTIHFFEAILATLAIIVWHFYFVIFNPEVYPMNLTWLTGWMSEREMHEEHPEELARIKAGKCSVNPPGGFTPGGPEST